MLTGIIIVHAIFMILGFAAVFTYIVLDRRRWKEQGEFNKDTDEGLGDAADVTLELAKAFEKSINSLRQTAKESGHNVEALAILQEELEGLPQSMDNLMGHVNVNMAALESRLATRYGLPPNVDDTVFDLEWRITALENRQKGLPKEPTDLECLQALGLIKSDGTPLSESELNNLPEPLDVIMRRLGIKMETAKELLKSGT